jgi:hypothetical protein
VKALGLLVVTDIRFCAKFCRYVGIQTSTCLPLGADASPAPLSAGVVASSPTPASLPPELDPVEPLLELLPELVLELPVDPLLDPLDPPLDPRDPLDPLLEPELDPPLMAEPPSSDGVLSPPVLAQPAASAHATQSDRARVDRRTAATTDDRAAPLLMVRSLPSALCAECVPVLSRSPYLQTSMRRIAPRSRCLSRELLAY